MSVCSICLGKTEKGSTYTLFSRDDGGKHYACEWCIKTLLVDFQAFRNGFRAIITALVVLSIVIGLIGFVFGAFAFARGANMPIGVTRVETDPCGYVLKGSVPQSTDR